MACGNPSMDKLDPLGGRTHGCINVSSQNVADVRGVASATVAYLAELTVLFS
jgi:hypothetical protein